MVNSSSFKYQPLPKLSRDGLDPIIESSNEESWGKKSLEGKDKPSSSKSSFTYRDEGYPQPCGWRINDTIYRGQFSSDVYRGLSLSLLVTNIITILFASWSLHLYRECLQQECKYQRPHVEIMGLARIPVEREIRQFHTGIRIGDVTPFFGSVNEQTNAAWATILDAGLVRLTPEQAKELPHETTINPHDPTSYVGVLGIFHELHCLNFLRTGFYNPDPEFVHRAPGDRFIHIDHCFEYLRQSIMCCADTSVLSIGWNATLDEYVPNSDSVKVCRNFDKIHGWAKKKENFVPHERGHRD